MPRRRAANHRMEDDLVYLAAGRCAQWWFGVAWEEECFVATAIGSSHLQALRRAESCLPNGVAYGNAAESSSFLRDAVRMLGELERGDETNKRFTLSPDHRSASTRRILSAAALVPIGYVATYGGIARAAGSEARAVGRAMATNPLYPIVPCHRVVGADMSLVGYGGKQDEQALGAKLDRLRAEMRGRTSPAEIEIPDIPSRALAVVPVERVIEAAIELARKSERTRQHQAAKRASEGRQLELF